MSSLGQVLTAVAGAVIGFFIGGGVAGALYGFEAGLLAGALAFPAKQPGTFGPRLTDGNTTTANVGDPLVIGFGTFTTSGTVMYLGECLEHSTTTSQGSKGAPSQTQTTYSYTQSIGIGLCDADSRIGGAGTLLRIWENGELVYDDRGEQPGETCEAFAMRQAANLVYAATLVFYQGDEFQLADPTIEADQGIGSTPAFRGLSYVVYPNRKLRDDQGQRHPTFLFECIGDVSADAESIVRAIGTLCGYDSATQFETSDLTGVAIKGYALASPMAGRDAIAPLRSVALFDVVESTKVADGVGALKFVTRGKAALRTLTDTDFGVYSDPTNADPDPDISVTEQQDVELPMQIRVSYLSFDADYAVGQQLSPARYDTDAVNIVDVELAVVLSDTDAKQIAEILWNEAWSGRDTYTISVDQSNSDIEPGDALIVPMQGVDYRMRVDSIADSANIMRKLTLISDDDGAYVSTAVAAPPQRPPPQVTVLSGTLLFLLDLPALSSSDNEAGFYAAACGDGTGNKWTGAVIYKSLDGDTFAQTATLTGSPPIGTLFSSTDDDPPITTAWDDRNAVDVIMVSGQFDSRTDDAVLTGANTIAVGAPGRWEIMQFATATVMTDPITHVQFTRLTHLLRGRRGTEAYVTTGSAPTDSVVGLTMGGLFRLTAAIETINIPLTMKAVTLNAPFASGTNSAFTPRGKALVPFSPVYIKGAFSGGDLVITWLRRDRFGFVLTSGVPTAMSEGVESYEIDIVDSAVSPGGVVRTLTASTGTVTYTSAMQIADWGTAQATYEVRIYQISATVGRGDPGDATIP